MSEENKGTYNLTGRAFFYLKNGKQVAHLDDGNNVVFETGFSGPHTRQLSEWMRENGLQYNNLPAPFPGAPPLPPDAGGVSAPQSGSELPAAGAAPALPPASAPVAPPAPAVPAKLVIEDIPPELLPPFDRMLGTSTPGFGDYVKRHNLNKDQVAALIRRLERN